MNKTLKSLFATIAVATSLLMPSVAQATTVTAFTDTSSSDFSAGTTDSTTTVASSGAVVTNAVSPTSVTTFNSSSLPSGWTATSWGDGSATVSDTSGTSVERSIVQDATTVGPGNSIEFNATFTAGVWQQAGIHNSDSSAYIDFATAGTGNVICVQTPTSVVSIDDTYLGSAHNYRIDWTATNAAFYIDNIKVASLPVSFLDAMYPYFADAVADSNVLTVSSARVEPDPVASVFTSRVLDAHDTFAWGPVTWNATPDNLSATLEVRTGSTATPDTSWTAFHPIALGAGVNATSRYLQYRAHLWTTAVGPVSLNDVTFTRATSVTDSTNFDYGQGTVSGGGVTDYEGGAVTASQDCEFVGSSLCNGWSTNLNSSQGQAVVGDDHVTLSGASVSSPISASASRSVQFDATFSNGIWQYAGFMGSGSYVLFSTGGSGSLVYAQTPDAMVNISDAYLNGPHHYRIDWLSSSATFYIDGTEVVSLPVSITDNMAPTLNDGVTNDSALTVDRVRVAALTNGTSTSFNSRIIDAGSGSNVSWSNANWNTETPTGTTVTVGARAGNTATPDGTWSTFQTLTNNQSTGLTGRYLQYQVILTSSPGGQVPTFLDATFATTALSMTALTQTSSSDFLAGSGNGAIVNGAQISSVPPFSATFASTLPSGWTGSASFNGTEASINNSIVQRSDQAYFKGANIEFDALMPGDHDERVGWNGAFFRSQPGTNLLIYNYTTGESYQLGGAWFTNYWHHYRIASDTSSTKYYVDGNLVGTFSAIAGTVTPMFWDLGGGNSLQVKNVTISQTSSTSQFTSSVISAGQRVCWGSLSWNGSIPSGTAASIEVRTGDTSTPDSSWSSFASTSSGVDLSTSSRYIQYRVTFTASGSAQPTIDDITMNRAYGGFC